ncbi:MAG: hypothetical protein H7146_00975 [Burkholderiaceae bacterium]|nr:hypothetical protein [Microbacteriaceae bacterium]
MTDKPAQGAPNETEPPARAAEPAEAEEAEHDEPQVLISESRVTVRRAPKYPRFIILGAGLGAIITYIGTAALPVDPEVGFAALFGYFALIGVPVGAALGAIAAIVLDAIATRRAKEFDAERTTVDAPAEDLEGDLED